MTRVGVKAYCAILLICLSYSVFTQAKTHSAARSSPRKDAKMKGELYLGRMGNQADIEMAGVKCSIKAIGVQAPEGEVPKKFKIELRCGERSQVLWDLEKPGTAEVFFDEPAFELLWAGDKDGDGKIDLEMEMSPKYSCTEKVTYLSSKASGSEIVGVSRRAKKVCGG